MYLIQFAFNFFINIHFLYKIEIVIIKATRLQAWAPAGGGGARVGRPPPLKNKNKVFWLYWGPFCYFFFICGPFCYVFLILGAFSPWGGLFATFYFMVGAFFWACPPLLRKFLRVPMIARRVREHAPRKFSEIWTCFVTILP